MHDFRAADVAAGGQGAPFVPVYHARAGAIAGREGPIVVVNIGGVANITYIDGADTLIACDTGPGNALLDDFMFRAMGQRIRLRGPHGGAGPCRRGLDRAGAGTRRSSRCRRRNRSTATILPRLKLARHVAGRRCCDPDRVHGGGDRPDRAAVAEGAEELDRGRRGARNLTMLRMLRERLQPATVEAADALGWSADAIEAQAFGFLAARGLKGLPLSYPATRACRCR